MLHLWSILKLVIGYNLYLAMRQISPTHLNAYKSGQLSKLFKVIIEDPELSFEIRKDNQVMIYYRKDKILTIKESKKGDFNFEILDPKYEIAPLWQPSPNAASISGSSCIICVTSSNDLVACAPSFETK